MLRPWSGYALGPCDDESGVTKLERGFGSFEVGRISGFYLLKLWSITVSSMYRDCVVIPFELQ
jgi:hypothetical protein